jgi:hypothetical protein
VIPLELDRGTYVVFPVEFVEFYVNYCVRGMFYKLSLLERKIISKVWGSYHNFHLEHPILVIPMELKIRHLIVL